MIDFAKRVLEDFMCGKLLFVGTKSDAKEISHGIYQMSVNGEPVLCAGEIPVVCRPHVFGPYTLIGYKGAHEEWHDGIQSPDYLDPEYMSTYVIPWSTTGAMIRHLNNDSFDEIIDAFVNSNDRDILISIGGIRDMDADDVISEISKSLLSRTVDIRDSGKWYTPRPGILSDYIEECLLDGYSNLYTYKMRNKFMLDAYSSASVVEQVVFPIAYLQEKLSACNAAYSESDFANVFD